MYRIAGWCEHTHLRSRNGWGTLRLASFFVGTATKHLIQIPDGPLILNPGSVGCPSYDDPGNDPHVSEAGSPHARYAVLTIDEHQVSAEMLAIPYDWDAASAQAEKNDRPEWAYGLRTGWFVAGPLWRARVGFRKQ